MLFSRLFIIFVGESCFFLEICTLFSLQRWQLNTVTARKQSYNSIFVNSRERRKNWVILKNWKNWFFIQNQYSYPEFSIEDPDNKTKNVYKCAISVFWKKWKKMKLALGSWSFPTFSIPPCLKIIKISYILKIHSLLFEKFV